MMLTGRIAKQEGPFWSADCDALGAHTQGESRKEAIEMLGEIVGHMIKQAVTVTEAGALGDQEYEVYIDCDKPELLLAEVLKHQREASGLTQMAVAKALGSESQFTYATYEYAKHPPTIDRVRELLRIVAPDYVLKLEPLRVDGKKASQR